MYTILHLIFSNFSPIFNWLKDCVFSFKCLSDCQWEEYKRTGTGFGNNILIYKMAMD